MRETSGVTGWTTAVLAASITAICTSGFLLEAGRVTPYGAPANARTGNPPWAGVPAR